MHVSSVSFAYPNTDEGVRARLSSVLRDSVIPAETFVLATCLRIEVVVTGDRAHLANATAALFGDADCLRHGEVRHNEQAMTHIFRVAAGLDSPILGEREILTQFRQSLAAAEERGSVSGLLAKLLETAVSVGRQARELLPESPHDSMAALAAQVVGGADRVAVFGSGTMARAVVGGLSGLPAPPEVTVVARNVDQVAIPEVVVWPIERATDVIATFPAVVSATSAKQRLIPDDDFLEALNRRSGLLTLVDMAMPPDLVPPAGAKVHYVSIDDLARKAQRRPRSHEADDMVDASAADAYRRVSDHHTVGPVIGALMRSADEIVDRTVERFASRLGHGDDRELLRQTAHTVARSLLAPPVAYLRSGSGSAVAADLLAEAFRIEDPTP